MLEGKNNWKAWIYLAPSLILLGVFSFYPIINSFIIAFVRDYYPVTSVYQDSLRENTANGLSVFTFDNFLKVFREEDLKYAVLNTAISALISVPVSVLLALIISVLLISVTKLRGFFQTLFFLPYVTSAMAVAMAFTVLFANTGTKANGISLGPVNGVLKAAGIEKGLMNTLDWINYVESGKEDWHATACLDKNGERNEEALEKKYNTAVATTSMPGSPLPDYLENKDAYFNYLNYSDDALEVYESYRHKFNKLGYIDWVGANGTWGSAIIVVLFYSIWSGLAFKILVFTGGLTSIDKQYYDAAKVDKTSKWRTFWKITVPMMSPLIVYILITSFIGAFKVYTSIVGLFGKSMGPAGKPGVMQTFVGLVYKYMAQGNSQIHFGAAASVFLFFVILGVTQITNLITKKKTHY